MSLTGKPAQRRSNARNAYELMSDIREYILEEPKRIWMHDWMIQGQKRIKRALQVAGPVCGTVGCIAGNAVILAGNGIGRSVFTQATYLLGGKDDYELREALWYLFTSTEIDASYGTKKYARIVAQRISRFQRDYKAQLLTATVEQGRAK